MDQPFILEECYDLPIDRLWKALTDLNAMKVWYFPQLKRFKALVGFDMEFDDDGSPYKKQWRVTQLVMGRKWAHSWIYKGFPGSSEVIFELVPDGNQTLLGLTHTGLASFPDHPNFARQRFEYGWKVIVSNKLREYLS